MSIFKLDFRSILAAWILYLLAGATLLVFTTKGWLLWGLLALLIISSPMLILFFIGPTRLVNFLKEVVRTSFMAIRRFYVFTVAIFSPVFRWMDTMYENPIQWWFEKDDRCQIVIFEDITIVIEDMFKAIGKGLRQAYWVLFLGFTGGLIVAVGLTLLPAYNALMNGTLTEWLLSGYINVVWQPLLLGILAGMAISLLWCLFPVVKAFFIGEWNRTHDVMIWYRKQIIFVKVTAPEGMLFISIASPTDFGQTKISSPGEPGGKTPGTGLERYWDGFLLNWSGLGIGQMFFPVKEYGGFDRKDFVYQANLLLQIIRQLAKLTQDVKDEKAGMAYSLNRIIYDVTRITEEQGWGAEASREEDVSTLFDEFIARAASLEKISADALKAQVLAGANMVDLWQIVHNPPNLWDRDTGLRVRQVQP
ncbi:hypothetical protein A2X44_00280 [candidate division CPR3 bacterium GWF2_35_18]|nr:MAG: hypothetical protein A2X44_00280 [candidate division CPR3 bacterium GWF2_35_18]OGB65582.1 MAG: hypothetical protein A2250_02235 [candidate division CPR3 bacterium RIFOXYA2_FULL_35_13]